MQVNHAQRVHRGEISRDNRGSPVNELGPNPQANPWHPADLLPGPRSGGPFTKTILWPLFLALFSGTVRLRFAIANQRIRRTLRKSSQGVETEPGGR